MFEKNELDEFKLKFIQKASNYFSNISEIYFLYISKLKIYFLEMSNNLIVSRMKLEISDIYIISTSIINSIGKTGQLMLGISLLFFIFFILVLFSKPSNKKPEVLLKQRSEKNTAIKQNLNNLFNYLENNKLQEGGNAQIARINFAQQNIFRELNNL